MTDLDTLDVVEFIEATAVTVHFTAKDWPMVGCFRPEPGPSGVLEPWQAREIAHQLQKLGDRLVTVAMGVESARAIVMAKPEHGGPDGNLPNV